MKGMHRVISKFFAKTEWAWPAAVLAIAALLHTVAQAAIAANAPAPVDQEAADSIATAISTQYPGARITIDNRINWSRGGWPQGAANVSLLGETSRGEMMFSATDSNGRRVGEGWVGFAAWQPAYVAVKRVKPGEKIAKDMFARREVNVAAGAARDIRGLILDPQTPVESLEARQSVLEGQILLSSAVQRVPDVRRGDTVTVLLVSNGLSLTTQGRVEEPAYSGENVRVTASKTKRALTGRLIDRGTVEVKL